MGSLFFSSLLHTSKVSCTFVKISLMLIFFLKNGFGAAGKTIHVSEESAKLVCLQSRSVTYWNPKLKIQQRRPWAAEQMKHYKNPELEAKNKKLLSKLLVAVFSILDILTELKEELMQHNGKPIVCQVWFAIFRMI